MAELDYAFLADYATVEGGRLTAVGASFTNFYVPAFPVNTEFCLAARIRVDEHEGDPELEVTIQASRSNQNVQVTGAVSPGPGTIVYDGKQGILVSLKAGVMVAYPELVTVDIKLNGEHARRLAFEVMVRTIPDV